MIDSNYLTFKFQKQLTQRQKDFFDKFGFLHFKNFISKPKVSEVISEMQTIEQKWIQESVDKVFGIPIRYGFDMNNNRFVQRFAFSSLHSPVIRNFLQEYPFKTLLSLLAPYEGRIGETEKDGVVINHYINTPKSSHADLGWHTDALRDVFYGRKVKPMLNVGLHLDTTPCKNGGLRILPGTHKQNIFQLLFRKLYFLDRKPDPKEIGLDIEAGDLTVHDGRMWHRVERSKFIGEKSRRRCLYVPLICDKCSPKTHKSRTPLYHRLGHWTKPN